MVQQLHLQTSPSFLSLERSIAEPSDGENPESAQTELLQHNEILSLNKISVAEDQP